MPRKPRIDLPGYHHIINRGVNRADIYETDEDYEMFLKIVCKACRAYRVILHDYCLMSNHFHLLVETEMENLSLFMKHINANYAIYFNKKTKRSGHLWQVEISLYSSTRFTPNLPLFQPSNKHLIL